MLQPHEIVGGLIACLNSSFCCGVRSGALLIGAVVTGSSVAIVFTLFYAFAEHFKRFLVFEPVEQSQPRSAMRILSALDLCGYLLQVDLYGVGGLSCSVIDFEDLGARTRRWR